MHEYGDKINQAVAAELRAQRARVRISFDELTERTGYAKTTVFNYLNGKRDIPIPALANICQALDIRMDDVFVYALKAAEKD